MEKRYRALRFLAGLWKIIGWIVLVVGVLSSLGGLLAGVLGGTSPQFLRGLGLNPALFGSGIWLGVAGFFFGLILTFIQFITFYALGELFTLLIDNEENTRLTVLWLQKLAQPRSAPTAPSPASSKERSSSGEFPPPPPTG